MKRILTLVLGVAVLVGVLAGCGGSSAGTSGSVTLVLGAYSAPQGAFTKLIPLFQAQWKQQTGQSVKFQTSYAGSGAQSRAIVNGFPADIAALSLTPDLNAIVKAGLITHDWTNTSTKGMITDSVVAFAVRKGNPLGIHDWADLARPGLQILTPDPKTSGGAEWNILAIYGAALRGEVQGVAKDDPAAAMAFLEAVLKNVKVMDKDARTSITDFEQGVGDVAITYESEVYYAQQSGQSEDLVMPRSTILIQSPAAVVDANVNKHGTRKVAEAFLNFLTTAQAQQVFADNGYRPVDPTVAQQVASKYTAVSDLWTIDYVGGWTSASTNFFGTNGIYTKAITAVEG